MKKYDYAKKYVIFFTLLASVFVCGYITFYTMTHTCLYSEFISTIATLVLGVLIEPLLSSIIELQDTTSWKSSQRKLEKADILKKDTPIRISFSYLFRIKVDGKYFLVRNKRTEKYQPVGGVYKFNQNEKIYLTDNFHIENDDRIKIDGTMDLEYRLFIKNKFLRKFVKRFDETPDRENISNLSREFVEELFDTGILNVDKNYFGSLKYKYCGRHFSAVEYSQHFQVHELLLSDIVEVELTDVQKELFRDLKGTDSTEYTFATFSEIGSLGIDQNNLIDRIANHTFKILTENTEQLSSRHVSRESYNVDL